MRTLKSCASRAAVFVAELVAGVVGAERRARSQTPVAQFPQTSARRFKRDVVAHAAREVGVVRLAIRCPRLRLCRSTVRWIMPRAAWSSSCRAEARTGSARKDALPQLGRLGGVGAAGAGRAALGRVGQAQHRRGAKGHAVSLVRPWRRHGRSPCRDGQVLRLCAFRHRLAPAGDAVPSSHCTSAPRRMACSAAPPCCTARWLAIPVQVALATSRASGSARCTRTPVGNAVDGQLEAVVGFVGKLARVLVEVAAGLQRVARHSTRCTPPMAEPSGGRG